MGSVWRKWDLQVQTILDDNYISLAEYYEDIKKTNPTDWQKYTIQVGGEDNAILYDSKEYFNDQTKDKKDRCTNYVRNFLSFIDILNPDLECIGITDHNYFDDQLLDAFIDYSKESRCKFIGGVEISCQGIHMLVFFPHNLYEKESFSAGIHAFLTKFNINNRKTAGVLTTTTSDIKAIIDEAKTNNGVVIFPHCNSSKGLFQGRTSTDRTHLADIFNHQQVNLLQAQNYQSSGEVSGYIASNNNLKSKYCVHISSDARALKDIGKCDKDGNYLWIKADPTFDGLKQIIYEAEQRIFIGSQKPEEKKPYFVIDKVRFIDNSADARFGSEQIDINQNLTALVGGKSTGKSLLLYYMAKTIDRQEVEDRISVSESIRYDFDSSADFNFEVTWKDGQSSLLIVTEEAMEQVNERKILYIPQKYLNTLSESNIKSREALNEFVLNVILQDPAVSKKHAEILQEIKILIKSIPIEIGELFQNKDDVRKIEEELKQTGDEKGIQTYIKTLQEQVDVIKAKSGLTEDQIKQYETLITREKEISTQISNIEEDRKTVKSLHSSLISQVSSIRSSINENEAYLNDAEIKAKFIVEMKVVDSFDPVLKTAVQNTVAVIEVKAQKLNQENLKIKADLAPLLAKVQMQADLNQKTEAIKKEQQKLNDISIKRNVLKSKHTSYKKKSDDVVDAYKQIIANYEGLRNEFKKFESKFGDITLNVLIGFKEVAFNSDVVGEYLNKHDLKRVITDIERGEEFFYKYDSQKHLTNIKNIFEGLISGHINTVKGRQVKDAVIKLLGDAFFLDCKICYKNDSLDKMSPGKKGLVLLQLLINLSDEEWPILLDQPEDDLDNRSVYDDLVSFIRKKKKQRQIIIVTHNPNLVVGADAEEIIVANQMGQERNRENKKYTFEYVSGAIENSFELPQEKEPAILFRKGIRQHVCEILEGGQEAFQKREQQYSFSEK